MKIKLIKEMFRGVKRYYLTAVLCSGISVLLYCILPLIIKVAVDSVVGDVPIKDENIFIGWFLDYLNGNKSRDLVICIIAFMGFIAFSALFEYLQTLFSVKYAQMLTKGLRDKLHKHILNLPNSTLGRTQTGDLIQRCTTDVEMIAGFFSDQFIKIFKTLLLIGIVLYFMLGLNNTMTAVSLAVVPFLFAYCISFFIRISKYFEKMEKSDSALNSVLQENLTGVRVVKAFARQDYETKKFFKANKNMQTKHFSVIKAFGEFWTVTEALSVIQMGLVIIFGAFITMDGVIEIGILVAFLTYSGEILWPVKELSMVLAEAGRVKVSLKRISEILDYKQEIIQEGKSTPVISGNIEFKNVSFSFGDAIVLNNISFTVKAGESLGILGETGSGKTTLVHLLQRIYDNYQGQILIDGIDIKDIDKAHLRQSLSLVLQESYLFSRTIRDNIKFGIDDVEQSLIEEYADKASIHETIKEFDKGYDTMVGESGVTLSGGQKQRVSIARSLLLKNPILIFDDSLSAVDSETDRAIRARLQDDSPTSIIISHRVSTLKECDKILVLEKGEITAYGSHDSIIKKQSLYKRILTIQDEIKDQFHMTLEEAVTCLAE